MKILNKTEFLKLPAGILYSCCTGLSEDCRVGSFGELCVKGDTCIRTWDNEPPTDWFEVYLHEFEHNDSGEFSDRLDEMYYEHKSYPLEIQQGRNGYYDEFDIFLVYEEADLKILISELQKCIGA